MNEYELQANNFLKDTDTKFKVVFLTHGKHFIDDKETRDIYEITLKRGERAYKFNFGQSIANSEKKIKPTAYDVLASLTNHNPDTFQDFCSSYGYDKDSIKAEKIFKAVVEEWKNIQMLFNDEEIEKMQEIQ